MLWGYISPNPPYESEHCIKILGIDHIIKDVQEDPSEVAVKPQYITSRSTYSKRLGDAEEG